MNVSARIHSGFNPATTGAHTAMRPNDDVADMHDAGSGIEESRAPAVAKQAAADRRTELISKMLGSHEKSSREVIGNMGGDGGGRKEPTKPKPMVEPHGVAHNTALDSTPRWIAV